MIQRCPYCKAEPLVRIHKSSPTGNSVVCNSCDENLLRYSSEGMYVKCANPICGYEGKELLKADYNTLCPRCNNPVLHS